MKIFDEKGITLIELLATFMILMIVLPVIYGVFSSGLKLYNKIQIEGQLRDDADYAITMIMNTFYSFPFDEVRECGTNCIELVDNKYTKVEKPNDSKSFYSVKQNQERDSETIKKIEFVEKVNNGKSLQEIEIDGKKVDNISDFSHSTISITCTNKMNSPQLSCADGKDGMVHIDLEFSHDRLEKPFTLKSQFGF